ncbi:MAG: class I SAM-dependent methyltransferase [Xanthomonadaceae bacterium]|jgi:S-adenosylmethionine-diacylgycerolhomoserine-N-methlytransferase|nr:class I SAM-dependent methyltransferase [Xanthomonadaceae bacterium]
MAGTAQAHRDFLNRYYRLTRHVYDATRKFYLLGRDAALRDILDGNWQRLVEIGPGTGRNLQRLREARPLAHFGGVEASDAMLGHARKRLPWATLVHGFAEDADYTTLLGARPDVVLFSYCLSMVQDPRRALDHARRSLAPGGRVVVVDFGDLAGLPSIPRAMLRRWLALFHVAPLDPAVLAPHQPTLTHGPGRYYVIATLPPLP